MEQVKKIVNKITGGTKLRKDQLLIMILSGILLCVIAFPTKKNSDSEKKETDILDSTYDRIGKKQTQQEESAYDEAGAAQAFSCDYSYAEYWEERLEQSLAGIENAGEIDVLITLRESGERIVEKDIPEETHETAEADAEGGSRTITERTLSEETVYTVNEEGQNVPYVRKIRQPVVEGVVVIAQGGDQAAVKQNIIDSIQVLFGIDANKIRVVKMKTKNK